MPTFVDDMLYKYRRYIYSNTATIPSNKISNEFLQYYLDRYEADLERKVKRKTTGEESAAVYLSQFKKRLKEIGVTPERGLNELRLNRVTNRNIMTRSQARVHSEAINIRAVDGDAYIKHFAQLLHSKQIELVVIGIAALSGRRVSEILFVTTFGPPKEPHLTHEQYWTHGYNFVKQRNTFKTLEFPLLVGRKVLLDALERVRSHPKWQVRTLKQANGKSKQLNIWLKRCCPTIGRFHNLRKFYGKVTFFYFNKNQCSEPRWVSDVLSHRTISTTVFTYLNTNVYSNKVYDYNGIPDNRSGMPPLDEKKKKAIKQ